MNVKFIITLTKHRSKTSIMQSFSNTTLFKLYYFYKYRLLTEKTLEREILLLTS